MAYLITIIPADNDKKVFVQETKRPPSLTQLQKLVGGYLEQVPHFEQYMTKRCTVYCNEEGKIRNLPSNERATKAWWLTMGVAHDYLCGDVAIVTVK